MSRCCGIKILSHLHVGEEGLVFLVEETLSVTAFLLLHLVLPDTN